MSTIRATYVQHGSSAVPNITLNASGQVIVASGLVSSGTFAAPSGTAAAPGVYFDGDTNTGIYSPGADQLAISTNGTGRLFVDSSGNVGIGTSTSGGVLRVFGATGKLIIGDSNYNYFDANTQVFRDSSANERMRLDSSGRLGLGTSTPRSLLSLGAAAATSTATPDTIDLGGTYSNTAGANLKLRIFFDGISSSGFGASAGQLDYRSITGDSHAFYVGNSQVMKIDGSGRVGVGTTSPATLHHVAGTQTVNERTTYKQLDNTTDVGNIGRSSLFITGGGTNDMGISSADALLFAVNGTSEAARIDSSGRLLVGTSTSTAVGNVIGDIQVAGTTPTISVTGFTNASSGSYLSFGKSRGTSVGTIVQSNDILGEIRFSGDDGTDLITQAANISAQVDGTPGANDMPGRLVFSTTRDGASSPTEAMRINSAQNILFPENATTNKGLFWQSGGFTTNVYALYQVSDGIIWRSFDTAKKLIGRVGTTGGVQLTNGATSWSAYTSESRLKDIVGDCDYDQAWSLVRDIELKRYFYKDQDDEFKKGVSYLGPMADWLEVQDPELVIYQEPDEDGPVRTFNQGLLDMKALAALSAALKRVEALEAEVAALKAR